ncbi:two-component sensor histidine kinase [Tessaracoccus sp. MC1865]|uniref:sensor histidine kinase n=1 Tax=Tessaracoccus sp. MC1865 TaxID=2760310 RepID=UPI0015FFDB11|nr:histidine kinase [Tessaracoccus sp. MC1865]MBB1482550.1 two-component sensor histidine kinase [Tessaracoccus sp. MC1865]QTO37997.1 two-component sensor histidine kinase [Tessaracoccus sp. MC1865]
MSPSTLRHHPGARRLAHLWGEVWRFSVALLLGMVMFGIRLEASEAPSRPALDITGQVTVLAQPVSEVWLAIDLLTGLLVLGALLLRRRWPLPVAVFASAALAVTSFGMPAAAVCLVSIASRRRWTDLAVTGPVLAAGVAVNHIFWPAAGSLADQIMSVVVSLVIFGAAWAWGAYRGARRELVASLRERAATLEREQTLRETQARTAERARIAQEMHDVLAHRISLIGVHANVLAFRSDLEPSQVAEHAGVIRDNADHAVAELRDVLGVLRGGELTATAPPQPTLDLLPLLIEDAQRAGTRVAAVGAMPDFDGLPAATSRTAYRVIQECLTNARKHANGLPVTLQVGGTEGVSLDIVVTNPLPAAGAVAQVDGTGMGLLGLAERVALAGGTLVHASEDGFFVVRAHLPWSG